MGGVMGSGATAHDNANILNSLIGTSNNANNPLFLANSLINNGSMGGMNILVQNWG